MNPFNSHHPIRAWFINRALDHPYFNIILSIGLTLTVGSGISFLTIDDDMMAMLPKDLDSRISWDAVQDEFGSTEVVFVAFGRKGRSIVNSESFAALWDVTVALQEQSVIDEVTCITTMSRIDSDDGFMLISDLQPSRELNMLEIERIDHYLNQNPSIRKRVLSRDEEYFNIMVQPLADIPHDVMRNTVVAVGDSVLSDFEVHYGGTAYITGSVPALIRNDISILLRVGLVIMAMILMINLRNLFAVGLVFAVIVQSLIVMVGFMGWMVFLTGSESFHFAIINTSMPIILLTIANSDGVHFITKFFKEIRIRKDTVKALEVTMDSLLVPIFLTSITTIAAFLSLSLAPIEQMMGYGVCISAVIGYAFFLI